mgnify:CR=1 FL=1|tara:strand:+ start:1166 stop:1600 length:435 start_codon:yes stop_codon:yes gene_type:complete
MIRRALFYISTTFFSLIAYAIDGESILKLEKDNDGYVLVVDNLNGRSNSSTIQISRSEGEIMILITKQNEPAIEINYNDKSTRLVINHKDSEGNEHTIIDNDGNGEPDLKLILSPERKRLINKSIEWRELKPGEDPFSTKQNSN